MSRFLRAFATLAVLTAATAAPADAQQNVAGYTITAKSQVRIGENHLQLAGAVELEQGDTKLYAENVEWFTNEDRAIASGNVVFSQGVNRIAADRAEFNTRTRLGTFYNASGIANVQPPRQTPIAGGIAVPQVTGQETDVYFFGDTVEKIGAKKYRITNGGFSTCVQPTPRWDLSADTIVLNIDHYTLLRQAVLKVKGVPMLYLPVMYYPTKDDDRATGFLIPTYGTSSIRGQSIHNAFFWAMNRSQDATIMHDWFSKTGQGLGTEYRYNLGSGSDGNIRAYMLDQHEATYAQQDGGVVTSDPLRSYDVQGSANQLLPGNLRARGRVSYFSSIATNQTFNTNVYDASRNNRSYGGNVIGGFGTYSLNGTFERNEYFNTTNTSGLTGTSPRVSISRNERPLFSGSQLYFSLGGDAAHLDRQTKLAGLVVDDRSLARFDFAPQIRYPFKKWQWFTVNSSMAWRDTFYSRSLDPVSFAVTDQDLNRQYFTVLAQVVGPVFTRVWNTPDNAYAERFKHTIEPFMNVQRTSSIDNYSQIVVIDSTDQVYGSTTRFEYGINNRFYAKRRVGQTSTAQEIAAVELTQSYYSNANASLVDPRYTTSNTTLQATNYSPIALSVRVQPKVGVNATMRAEFDSHYHELRTLSANGTYNWRDRLQTSAGWSHKFYIQGLAGFDPAFQGSTLDHYINIATTAHTRNNRYGSIYSINYDVLRSTLLQQRISGFYNAQCCGIAFEYQTFNFGGVPTSVLPADHRFFMSFTLAGLGNFSPFNGALGGVPR